MQIFRRLRQGPASTELALGVRSVAAEDGEKAEQPDGAIDDPDRLAEERLCGAYNRIWHVCDIAYRYDLLGVTPAPIRFPNASCETTSHHNTVQSCRYDDGP
jgi:hypothetical protein